MGRASGCGIRRIAGLVGVVSFLGLIAAPAALASPADIQSAGPLSDIWIGDDLGCQVVHSGVQSGDFYGGQTTGPASCGTMLSLTASGNSASGSYGINGSQGGFTAVTPPTLTGSGTSQDPFVMTTVVSAVSSGPVDTGVTVTEKDTYVVGSESYRTDITVANNANSGVTWSGGVYHVGDCYLNGSDSSYGFIDTTNHKIACTQNPNNSPSAGLMQFADLSGGVGHLFEGPYSTGFRDASSGTDYPNMCDCTTFEDSGEGINWDFTALAPGQSATFSMQSTYTAPVSSITATGGNTFSGDAPLAVSNATVASFTDTNTSAPASSYGATINWGDGGASAGSVSGGGGSFDVTGSHTYNSPGSYTITVTISPSNGSGATATDSATVTSATSPPSPVQTGAPAVNSSSAVVFRGSAVPNNLPTTGRWIFGLDPSDRGPGFSGNVYDQSTPSQLVGSDSTSHTISFPVSGLMPNSRYHVRFVASNSAGTNVGPDQTFTTPKAPVSSIPPIGTENFTPSGTIFVLVHGQFVKLTQTLQLPSGTVVDATNGSLTLTSSSGGSGKASDAKAKKGKKVTKFTGTFGSAVFKVTQTTGGPNKGLTTLTLMDGLVKGTPSYASCKGKAADATAQAARLSSRILQTLRARSSGRYRTRGRYAAGTVRGTQWTTSDRCDGTLIRVQVHSVLVSDLVKHINVLVTAGHSYLAKAHK